MVNRRTIGQEDAAGGLVSTDSEPSADGSPAASSAVRGAARRPPRDAGRLLDLKTAEVYSGIGAWTLRDLIASGDLPAVRPPRLRRLWIDRADLDKAIAGWKDRAG